MSKEKEVVELTLAERISLLSILPKEANFATLKIMRTLKEGLSFSEEEHKDYEIKVDIGDNGNIGYAWNEEGVKSEKAIKIGEIATDVIVKELKKLDKENKLTEREFSLYEKFIEK